MKDYSAMNDPFEKLDFGEEHTLDLFAGSQMETGSILVPKHRILLADYTSAGTVVTRLGAPSLITPHEVNDARDKIFAYDDEGALHEYRRRTLFPFNEPEQIFCSPLDAPMQYSRLKIAVEWDSDIETELGIGDIVRGKFEAAGKDARDDAVETEIETEIASRIVSFNLATVDIRANDQPIVLTFGNTVLNAIPDEEDWIIQQCYAKNARYDGFESEQFEGPFYDKLTPESPDLRGFVGASALVPYNLDALSTIKLAFVDPAKSNRLR